MDTGDNKVLEVELRRELAGRGAQLIVNYQNKEALLNAIKQISVESIVAFKEGKCKDVTLLVPVVDNDMQKVLDVQSLDGEEPFSEDFRQAMFKGYVDAKVLNTMLEVVGKDAVKNDVLVERASSFLEVVKNLKPQLSKEEYDQIRPSTMMRETMSKLIHRATNGGVMFKVFWSDVGPISDDMQTILNTEIYDIQPCYKLNYALETGELKHLGLLGGGFLETVHDVDILDMDKVMWQKKNQMSDKSPFEIDKAWLVEEKKIGAKIKQRKEAGTKVVEQIRVEHGSKDVQSSLADFEKL